MSTKIEWTDETWNPSRGCSRVNTDCDNCYAMRQARRQDTPGGAYEGLTRIGKRGVDWSGKARLVPEALELPLRWKKPRRIFVDSMSDLFHESLSNEDIAAVFGVMAACPRHTFQVLTKRPARARAWFRWEAEESRDGGRDVIGECAFQKGAEHWHRHVTDFKWPLKNVWLGVSAGRQESFDELVDDLLKTPAALRFLSAEPLLGPMTIAKRLVGFPTEGQIDWVIAGGESGHGARPMHPAWALSLADQCTAKRIPFFFKQWGNWFPLIGKTPNRADVWVYPQGGFEPWSGARHANIMSIAYHAQMRGDPGPLIMRRIGKKNSGRLLDGKLFDGFPAPEWMREVCGR